MANPISIWSEVTLYLTGAGLPPGPGGLLGAAEGVRCVLVQLVRAADGGPSTSC